MTLRDEIAALRARISRALSDRDTWRASGSQEKYMEASCVAETLELQLEQMRQEGLRATARNAARAGTQGPARPGGAGQDTRERIKP
jgi:hypothetical protein